MSKSKKFNWKKELRGWLITLAVFAGLYFSGLHTPIIGALQSLLLYTQLWNPATEDTGNIPFRYEGELVNDKGNKIAFDELHNQTLFINYWATWCPPCLAEMPHINKLYESLKDEQNIQFLLISRDEDFSKAISFMEKKGYDIPIFTESEVNPQLRRQVLPTTFVISPDGKIIFEKEGMGNFNTDDFKDFLRGQ
ncbi:TlpA family protein disulfide reductase [Marivirga sp. S37H4]|uniref:TlpA family protein disulfide reductase n=1 Tax=Marivirga aurantiaca TaxID=2802615 RepID=A0A934X1Q7_9BACT|nr:TlpA disulfide reductase family protein [Marivirga aurantiaca]MBK6267383.1 TlpA family protein disulfide reductase [Marivirga aurantiaca]